MSEDDLYRLRQALALITQQGLPDEAVTLGDLGVDSRHLVELMVACDQIYGSTIRFEELDISIETSVRSLRNQILLFLGR